MPGSYVMEDMEGLRACLHVAANRIVSVTDINGPRLLVRPHIDNARTEVSQRFEDSALSLAELGWRVRDSISVWKNSRKNSR
jgi:hypothetical protein